MFFRKANNNRILLASALIIIQSHFGFSQQDFYVQIEAQSISTNTGSKPQSKVWKYGDSFYSVFPNKKGTYVWKLAENQWIQHLLLTTKDNSKADCFAVSDTVFILLYQGVNSEFTIMKFDESAHQYQFINPLRPVSPVEFHPSTETATLALDGNSTLWMTYEADNRIEVRNSMSPYSSWSKPTQICEGVASDDISGIIKMTNSVGVFWSNQNTERFGFRFHVDGDPISFWSSDEVPASQSALDMGNGMADDHLNLKFTSNGQLYAAVKTSYDAPAYPKIALLVRRSNGIWENLHHVSYSGTRPIVAVDMSNNSIKVYYTSVESGGAIMVSSRHWIQ